MLKDFKNRIQFLDLMRGWVILIMIEVHVFNDMLLISIKSSSWFQIVNFINGMVAPIFLFVSGFIFVINSIQKKEECLILSREFWKQLKRIAMVWIIGYFLHFPFNSYLKLISAKPEEWQNFFQSDILHCIAFGWFILFISRFIFKKDNYYQLFILISGILFIVFSLFFWKNHYSINFFTAYLNGQISLFPIFPWLGFLFLGGWIGFLYQKNKKIEKEFQFFKWSGLIGIILILIAYLFSKIQMEIDWRANPIFFMIRFGVILVFMTLLWFYETKKTIKSFFLLTAGKESLFIYVGHLLILYTAVFSGKKLSEIFQNKLTLLEGIAATGILLLVMIFSAKLWQIIKQKTILKKTVISVFLSGVLLLFFLQ